MVKGLKMATQEQIEKLKTRIKQADSLGALYMLEDKLETFYDVGELTEKEFQKLDLLIMDKLAELS